MLYDLVRQHDSISGLKESIPQTGVWGAGNLAQAEILRECTLVQDYADVTLITGQEIYNSTDSTFEFLLKAQRIVGGYSLSAEKRPISVRTPSFIDNQRSKLSISGSTIPQPPLDIYHIPANPLKIGFGIAAPDSAYQYRLRYQRKHATSDNLSASVDPLIPSEFDDLLILGTVIYYLGFKVQCDDDRYAKLQSRLYPLFLKKIEDAKLRLDPEFISNKDEMVNL